MVYAPPGSAKSSYVSVLLPSWYIAANPKNSILAASHTVTLAEKWGRRVRNTVQEFGLTLGVKLAADSHAAGRWATTGGGEYLAAGVGVGIAGFRADLGIVDDAIGSREQAYSKLVRDNIWEWFSHDFSSRLKPSAKRVIINTRWHEDDLSGRIEREAKKGKYRIKVLSLPAVAGDNDPLGRRPGEWLWDDPSGYNYGEFLRARKREVSPSEWAALYQQNPQVDGGNIFKREEWQLFEGNWPAPDITVAALDPAYTEKQENDPSALTVWRSYVDEQGKPKVVLCAAWRKRLQLHGPEIKRLDGETDDAYRRRASPKWGLCEWVADTCDKLKVDVLLVEAKGPGISIIQEMRRLYRNKEWGIIPCDPKGQDKVARAWSVQHLWTEGLIYAPERDFADMVKDEMAAFPRGQLDDLTDTAVYAVEFLRRNGFAKRNREHHEEELELLYERPRKPVSLYES